MRISFVTAVVDSIWKFEKKISKGMQTRRENGKKQLDRKKSRSMRYILSMFYKYENFFPAHEYLLWYAVIVTLAKCFYVYSVGSHVTPCADKANYPAKKCRGALHRVRKRKGSSLARVRGKNLTTKRYIRAGQLSRRTFVPRPLSPRSLLSFANLCPTVSLLPTLHREHPSSYFSLHPFLPIQLSQSN